MFKDSCMTKFITIFVSFLTAVSCAREINPPQETVCEAEVGVFGIVPDFSDGAKSSLGSNGAFAWSQGDVIGVVALDGKTFQTNYEIAAVGADARSASFNGGAWKLKDGKAYAAYYPCAKAVMTSASYLDFTMAGQKQLANNSSAHLGAYDLMYAKAVTPASGRTDFTFQHEISLVKLTLPVKESTVFTSLSLDADSECFISDVQMSLADGGLKVKAKSSTQSLELDNISVAQGSTIVAWMAFFPTEDVRGKQLAVTLTAADGAKYVYDINSAVEAFEAGVMHELTASQSVDVIFADDFTWLSPFITTSCADFVNGTYADLGTRISYGNNNSINLHSVYPDTFPNALASAGYKDYVPTNKTIYGQGTKQNPYLKFCKTDVQTALVLQPFKESFDEADIEFDWAVHMTTSALDAVDLQIRIEGDGSFSNGTKTSSAFTLSQQAGQTPKWSHASATLKNVNSSTRLLISSREAFDADFKASGVHRFYLDNIIVSKEKGGKEDPVTPEPGSTVYGLIRCGDNPVANVVVSDGYQVVKTNAQGVYQLASAKKTGYVFISIPSGYEVGSDGVLPVFHKYLVKKATEVERVDFELYDAGDQTNHTILYMGDMHMANRTNDKNQFRKFTTEIAEYVNSHPGEKIYGITLGDMTWDLYWYSRSYCFEQYLNEYKGVVNNLQIFHTIGNHDHDMNATGDWDTVIRFRNAVCPNYYSFNIGKIHYISIDDIQCTNDPASKTDGSGRKYNDYVVNDVLNWMKKDLSFVSKTTPIVVTMHAPVYTKDGGDALNNVSALTSVLSGYNVTFVSGHSHVCYTVDKSSAIREHNNGAVCAAWWWAGKYWPDYNIGTDGAPSGYRVMSVKGTKQTSYFKATGRDASYQFRAYDRNKINLDLSMVPSAAQNAFAKELALSLIYGNYSGGSSSNDVIINVWDWNKNWKIEVTENGKSLSVVQKTLMDPSFYIAYDIPHLKAGNTSVSWHPSPTNHMFVVTASSATSTLTIKVTDDEGRVYTEKMYRPLEFKVDNYIK